MSSNSRAAVHRVHELERMVWALRQELTQSKYQLSRFLPPPPSHPSTDQIAYSGVSYSVSKSMNLSPNKKDDTVDSKMNTNNLEASFAEIPSSSALEEELRRSQEELDLARKESLHWQQALQQAEEIARTQLEEVNGQNESSQIKLRALMEENARLSLLVDVQNDAHTNMQDMLEHAMQ